MRARLSDVQRSVEDQQPPEHDGDGEPATGGMDTANMPLIIISTLSTIDHVADARISPVTRGITPLIVAITHLLTLSG